MLSKQIVEMCNIKGETSAILGEPFGRADNKVEWSKKFVF
jgi:hypothetical protein